MAIAESILFALCAVALGLVYASAVEWMLHKYLLHGVGRNKASFWSFHWHDHHRAARKGGMFDPQYVHPLLDWGSPQLKEAVSVLAIALLHAPLLPFFPVFTVTVWFGAARYYFVHRRAHLDREWCKRHLPWHYDHHMGRDQDANWCATSEWFDILMGTRKVYRYDEAGRPVAELQVSWSIALRRALRLSGG
jgi:hypothetical protein